jgi:divalent metal cation (Fe/Co/Zn/Cd) transporter
MRKPRKSPVDAQTENLLYGLLLFFICLCCIKGSLGAASGSQALLVSGIFSMFGGLVSIVALLRLRQPVSSSFGGADLEWGKLEFFLVVFVSLVIALSAIALCYSCLHLALNHTPFPPDMLAGWTAVFTGAASWVALSRSAKNASALEANGGQEIILLLWTDFAVSVLLVFGVTLSRAGYPALDLSLAILEALLAMGISVWILRRSVRGLLDASCGSDTILQVSECLRQVDQRLDIRELRVTRVGGILEIVTMVGMPGTTSVKEAGALVRQIRRALEAHLPSPHEAHVGFRGVER